MVPKRNYFIIILVFILAITAIIFINKPQITGLTTILPINPSINLNLTSINLLSNQPINGELTITLNGPFEEDSFIAIKLDNELLDKKDIKTLLGLKSITYTTPQEPLIQTVDSSLSNKTFTFTKKDKNLIGFKIAPSKKIMDVSMKVSGSSYQDSYPSDVSLNVLDPNSYNEKIEWHYIGFPIALSSEFKPSSFGPEDYKPVVTFSEEIKYLCRKISNIPLAKKFTVFLKYKKEAPGGNIRAALMQCEDPDCTSALTNTLKTCDLEIEPDTFKEDSCVILYDQPIKADNLLACVYTTGQDTTPPTPYYKIIADQSGGHLCNHQDNVNVLTNCPQSTSEGGTVDNPHIRIKEWVQEKRIFEDTQINFNDWMVSPYNINESIEEVLKALAITYLDSSANENYLSHCDEDLTFCIVPLEISSETAGKLDISNLIINLQGPSGGIGATIDKFYEVKIIPQTITTIINKSGSYIDLSITPLTFTIPLSTFNLTAPTPSTDRTYDLKVELSTGPSQTQQINVSSTTIQEPTTLESKISTLKSHLDSVNSNPDLQDTLTLLNYEFTPIITELTLYEINLQEIKQSNKTASEKETEISVIESNFTSLTSNTPKQIQLQKKIGPIETITSPQDITSDISYLDRLKLNEYQNKARIELTASLVRITTSSNSQETKTIVKKTIIPKETLTNLDIIEFIPKSAASTTSEILFNIDPIIIKSDPIIKWHFNSLSSPEEIIYGIDKDIISDLNSVKTFLVPEIIPIAEPTKKFSTCGDGKCTLILEDSITCPEDCKGEIPWSIITLLLILMVIGIIIILLYKKGFFKEVKEKIEKPKFKSPKDIELLVAYIEKSQKQGYKISQITTILLKKGWLQPQIDYAFKISKRKTKKSFFSKFIKFKREQPKKPKEQFPFFHTK